MNSLIYSFRDIVRYSVNKNLFNNIKNNVSFNVRDSLNLNDINLNYLE
jgi:hypothetical protein